MLTVQKPTLISVTTLVCGLFFSGSLLANDKVFKDRQLKNFDFGVFCFTVPMNKSPAPNTASGWIHKPDDMPAFHWKTTTVPASKSIAFGVRASAKNSNILNAEIIVTHPEIKGRTQNRWKTKFRTNTLTLDFYRFDFINEMKPGRWIFQAVKDGKVLYKVEFKVVPANAASKIVSLCK